MSEVSPPCLDGREPAARCSTRTEVFKSLTNQPRSYRAEDEVRSRDTIRFAGYAALFGIPDADRDTILPGAFSATLAGRSERLPLFWQHRPSQRIGWIETAQEDGRGLRVVATLDPGSRPASLLAGGAVNGLSFGYRARDFRQTPQGRTLRAVDLFEVSLVTHPLQHGARVHWTEPNLSSTSPRPPSRGPASFGAVPEEKRDPGSSPG